MKKNIIISIISLLLCQAYSSKAREVTTLPQIAGWIYQTGKDTINPYANEGELVNGSGFFLGALLYVPGTLITLPFCAMYEPFAGEESLGIGSNTGRSSYWVFHTIGGFPLYVVKKIVWDIPAHFYTLFTTTKEEEKSNKPVQLTAEPPCGLK